MKAYILLSILTIFCLSSYSQKWEHIYGNPDWYEGPEDVTEAYDKGYLVLGNTGYNDHGWLFKTDLNGDMLWEKYFGGAGQDPIFNCIEQDDDGSIYVAGLMKFDELMSTSIIFKLDQCGELLWCKTYYTENYDYCRIMELEIINDSTLICLANHHDDEEEDKFIFLYSVNSLTGNIKWKKPYAIGSEYPLLDVSTSQRLILFNNLFIISGSCYWADPNSDTTHFYLRPFFIGIDTLFNEKWVLAFGVNDSLLGRAWGAIPVSDSIFLGYGKRLIESTSHSFLMIFDYYGNEIGYSLIGNEQIGNNIYSNSMNSMKWINDSLLFGSVGYKNMDEVRHFCDIKVDTEGNVYSVVMVDTLAGSGGVSSMIKTHDGKYVVTTGYIENNMGDIYLYKKNSDLEHDTVYPGYYNYDSLCNEQIVSNTISLGGCDIIVDIEEVPTLDEYNADKQIVHISAFPNPALSNEITLQFKSTNNFSQLELRCYNVFGKLVHKEKVYQNQDETNVNIEGWNCGIYLAIVYDGNKVVGQSKFMVQ